MVVLLLQVVMEVMYLPVNQQNLLNCLTPGTIVLGSTFSPGFDVSNPFHIDIHNCNNCAWLNPNTPNINDLGIYSNAGEQVVLYEPGGNIEMGVYWNGGQNEPLFGNLMPNFMDDCTNNLILEFPDPVADPRYIDFGDLGVSEGCAISIPCATIDDNGVSADPPVSRCTSNGENSGIGGSSPFTQIGPFDAGSGCFYVGNTETFQVRYQPISLEPQVIWSSPTGLLFESFTGPVNSTMGPSVEVLFVSAGNHAITMALQLPGDNCIYYYTEDIFVEESVDLSDLNICLGTDFTIDEAPPGLNLTALAVSESNGLIVTVPQSMLPATFNIPESLAPGTYILTYLAPPCRVDVSLEVFGADEISIVDLPASVTNDDAVFLNATPEGGVFSGNGVVFDVFNPSVVPSGIHKITYTYTNEEGCVSEVSENIFVTSIIYNFVNFNFITLSPKIIVDIDVAENGIRPVSVTGLDGRTLFNINKWLPKGNQQITIDTNGWPKGIYFVKIGQFGKPEKVYVH